MKEVFTQLRSKIAGHNDSAILIEARNSAKIAFRNGALSSDMISEIVGNAGKYNIPTRTF